MSAPIPQARDLARRDSVEIRYYSIIYDVIDDMKAALSGMLSPTLRERFLGNAAIREVFNITKVGKVAGCMVTEGVVKRGAKVRLLRDNVVIHEGSLKTLKRFKDEVREVKEGFECGMAFENYHDIQGGDQIECFEIEEVARALALAAKRDDPKAKPSGARASASCASARSCAMRWPRSWPRGELRDPALAGLQVTVTEVRVSPDLRTATAFVVPFGGGDAAALAKALNRAAGFFRTRLADAVELRVAPDAPLRARPLLRPGRPHRAAAARPEVARDLAATPKRRGPEDDDDGA